MRSIPAFVASAAALAGVLATRPASAQLTNDGPINLTCTPTPQHPYPAVLVHGQAGNVEGMNGVSDRLIAEGWCVYGKNYGSVPGGFPGQDHLWNSAAQIADYIDQILQSTGAKKVDVIGHSAGTGVLDNYIMTKGGASKVHGFVSFDGLHHPYFHVGVPTYFDIDIYLPNLIPFGQKFFPGLTITMITDVLAGMVGGDLAATIRSPFAADLFDTKYWLQLQGAASEPDGTFLKLPSAGRTFPTHDSVPDVCYTSIVAIGDMLVGGSAGWLDQGGNIDNFLTSTVVTANTHNDVLGNKEALDRMVAGLKRDCSGGNVTTKSVSALSPLDEPQTTDPNSDAARKERWDAFAREFLNGIVAKYGDQLERSDVPLPSGVNEPPAHDSASSCAVGYAQQPKGQGAMVALFAALGLAIGLRARRKR